MKDGHLRQESLEEELWVTAVRNGTCGGEERRYKGEREVKLIELPMVIWWSGKEVVTLVTEVQGWWIHMWQGSETNSSYYSSLPGSSSLSSPRGNSLVGFWVAHIRVSMAQSWLRIAWSKTQEEQLLHIFFYQSPCSLPSLAHPSLVLLRKDSRNKHRILFLIIYRHRPPKAPRRNNPGQDKYLVCFWLNPNSGSISYSWEPAETGTFPMRPPCLLSIHMISPYIHH